LRWRQLLDPITEPPPRLARLRSGGDPGTNRRCHQGGEKWIIAGQRVVAALQSAFFQQPHDAPRRARHHSSHVFRLWGRQREKCAGGMRGAGVDAVEQQCVKMRREIQR